MTVPATARRLGLEPHPEGGWYRRTWASDVAVETAGGMRPTATCIHYLLQPDEHSDWHVVTSDELWLWHGPGTLELRLGGDGDAPADGPVVMLGRDAAFQAIVSAGTWQAARPGSDEEVLVSCIVSPGFDFADWRLDRSNTL